jgi:hypothetical protein
MEVADIEVDLHSFHTYFEHYYVDLQVLHEYINLRQFLIIVRRLDTKTKGDNEGWVDNVNVLVNYITKGTTQIVNVGSSPTFEKYILVNTEFDIAPSLQSSFRYPRYCLKNVPNPTAISRQEFNSMFDTDIVMLPHNLYAFGVKEDKVYIYNEKYGSYYEMIHSTKFILKVLMTYMDTSQKNYHFIICSDDGYYEKHFMEENRDTPRRIGEEEFRGFQKPILENPREYPVFYKKKWIWGQSILKHIPYSIGIPDRHFFYCNLYNPFRSFHRGIPFQKKQNQIVFGCRKERGGVYNYTVRRDIEINQREYFYSDNVCKDNVVYTPNGWIADSEMVNYKYILDVDGNASTWDATAWKLNSGSVIMKTDGPWKQWFYDEYLPWVHYIPIKDDFSDLQEKYNWCETHQLECEEMVRKCKCLFQKIYRVSNMIEYIKTVLNLCES